MAWFKNLWKSKKAEEEPPKTPEAPFRPARGGRPPIDRERARELYDVGFSLRQVAALLHVSKSAVQRAVKRADQTRSTAENANHGV